MQLRTLFKTATTLAKIRTKTCVKALSVYLQGGSGQAGCGRLTSHRLLRSEQLSTLSSRLVFYFSPKRIGGNLLSGWLDQQ